MNNARAYGFLKFDQESYLARRLGECGLNVFHGTSDSDVRRERFRSAIMVNNLAQVEVGKIAGRPETFAQLFQRIFNEPLHRGIYDAHG
jgi:hypothetical protein